MPWKCSCDILHSLVQCSLLLGRTGECPTCSISLRNFSTTPEQQNLHELKKIERKNFKVHIENQVISKILEQRAALNFDEHNTRNHRFPEREENKYNYNVT